MPTDPLDRFRQLVEETRHEVARLSHEQPGRTAADVAEGVGLMRMAEGKVLGYLEALTLTRPELAREAVEAAEKLSADVQAILFTMPASGPREPFPEED